MNRLTKLRIPARQSSRRARVVKLKRAVRAGLYLVPADTVARAIVRHAVRANQQR